MKESASIFEQNKPKLRRFEISPFVTIKNEASLYNFREYLLENPTTMYIYSRLVSVSRLLNTMSAVGLDKQISSDFNRHALVYFPYKFVAYRPCGLHSSEVGEVGRAELTTWTVPNFCLPVPRCGQNLVQFVYGICTLTFSCIISLFYFQTHSSYINREEAN